MSDNIQVVVKVRPLIQREIEDKLSFQWRVTNNTLYQLDHNGKDLGPNYTFDKVYNEKTKTSDVYNDIAKPIVQAAIKGFNGTIFAYGQTSSGKTFTMMGTENQPGIIPLAVIDLFETIKNIPDRDFLVRVSYIEIYNDSLQDLFSKDQDKKSIKIHDTLHGIKVDVEEKMTSSPDEVLELMKTGQANRQTGSTNMNEQSSRSHTIFQITIESREHMDNEEEAACVNVSVLNLVDLAGSERAGQTGATGQRFLEGTHINKSLSTLATVIRQLAEEAKFISYRDSKLTRILQNSLGGNAKTSIICAITPAAVEETVSTLQFANRAKAIKNKPEVVVRSTDDTMIQNLTKKLGKLQSQLESKKHIEQANVNLQKKIAELQQLIINGFGRRSDGARRKPTQLRRATISTLPSTEEDDREHAPVMPRFCTPILKYNPHLLPGPELPTLSIKPSLSSVPEETRAITPSPKKQVNICEKVVEIVDSDDEENTSDLQTCSPRHDCYNTLKTPPCVLRKQAKQIEKDYRDLQQLTELERMYPPKVVELIKNLEEKSNEICSLHEEIDLLKKKCKQKDFDMSLLQAKVTKTEEEIKKISIEKAQLESQCKEITTKLTESEVLYELLQKKAQKREEELLGFLGEHRNQKTHMMGTPQKKSLSEKELVHFMDFSKDISLVSSDNECSETNNESGKNYVIATEMNTELDRKQVIINDLENYITKLKENIECLEVTSQKQVQLIDDLTNKVTASENENCVLKKSIDTLNSTIKVQEQNIEDTRKDIISCNEVIKDLQVKLNSNKFLPDINISDDVIQGLSVTEDRLKANNENMQNISRTLSTVIDDHIKEICKLRKTIEMQSEKIESSYEEIKIRDGQILLLSDQLQKLKIQETKNITIIDELLSEKENRISSETQLTEKLKNIQNQINLSDTQNKTKNDLFEELKNHNNSLKKIIQEKDETEIELRSKSEKLSIQIQEYALLLTDLRSKICEKDSLIISLQEQNHSVKSKIQPLVIKFNNMINLLTGSHQNISDLDNIDDTFNHLHILLNATETQIEDYKSRNSALLIEEQRLKVQIATLFKENDNLRLELTRKSESNINEIQTLRNENENFRLELTELREQYSKVKSQIQEITKSSTDLQLTIETLSALIKEKTSELNIKNAEYNELTRQQQEIFENISCKAMDCVKHFDLETKTNTFENIMQLLQILYDNMRTNTECKDTSSTSLDSNLKMDICIQLKGIQEENKMLNEDLRERKQCLESVHNELKEKSYEIGELESKVHEWKTQFQNLKEMMKTQLEDLQKENFKLKEKGIGYDTGLDNSSSESELKQFGLANPPSLVSLTCNKIQDLINTDSSAGDGNKDSNFEYDYTYTSNVSCQCSDLTQQLEKVRSEKTTLMDVIRDLQSVNKKLLEEQETMREEVQLLIEPSKELQKKISNHKTILSTLTATTYAEHQLLKSRVTALQHHHSRFHNICLRDLPSFKEQLDKLMNLLKGESSHNNSEVKISSPHVRDINCSTNNFKNESTLDPDLLMMDTNLTMTTINNTLMCHDQTCLIDVTQAQLLDSDISVGVQNLSLAKPDNEIKDLEIDMLAQINKLKNENIKLQKQIDNLSRQKCYSNAQCSPIKLDCDESNVRNETMKQELMIEVDSHKKRAQLLAEKVNSLEQECVSKTEETINLKITLEKKNKELLELQEENGSLSNQIMDNLTEVDNLKYELDLIKQKNLSMEASHRTAKETIEEDSNSRRRSSEYLPLNRSLSDPDSASSYNKISNKYSEMCAEKQDCKQLTQEVTAERKQLEQDDISAMDLDDSIVAKDLVIAKETSKLDSLMCEKLHCLKFYEEKMGSKLHNPNGDFSVVEMMHLLHDKLLLEHRNEVENLNNKLKDLDETKTNLQTQIQIINADLLQHRNKVESTQNILKQIRSTIGSLSHEISNNNHFDDNYAKLLSSFKEVLKSLDVEFELSSSDIFSFIIDNISQKHESDLVNIMSNCTELKEKMDVLITENNVANSDLTQMKQQMDCREEEYKLLKLQKEKVHEISNAVTLNIIKKEQELNEMILKGHEILMQHSKITIDEFDPNRPASKNLVVLFELLIKQKDNSETENLILKLEESKSLLADKDKFVDCLQIEIENLKSVNEKLKAELLDFNIKTEKQSSAHEELQKRYKEKTEENDTNIHLVANLTETVGVLKQTIIQNEAMLQQIHSKMLNQSVCESCNDKETFITELLTKISLLEQELKMLKEAHKVINNEKDKLSIELETAGTIIAQNKLEMEKMNADILVLRESTKDNISVINNLRDETKSLIALNMKLKEQFEEKCRDCSRLEINIKTHEKTAEIQSKMIIRIQNQKDEVEALLHEKDGKIEELSQKLVALEKEHEAAVSIFNSESKTIEELKRTKAELERRVSELELDCVRHVPRSSTDNADSGRRRRRASLMDSRRDLDDVAMPDDKIDDFFVSRAKPDDLFMDGDDNSSNRSTPAKSGRRKSDVRGHSRLDQYERESDGSRPSSVSAARKQRRQSSHDLHRTLPHQRPPSSLLDESKHSDASNRSSHENIDNTQLKERIAAYQQEIEELKERNRELDDECETCAEYLREREEQCVRLKKEKAALETTIAELQEKVKSTSHHSQTENKPVMTHASVNTDKDWANLHSVVVDRMSYDAEVEKNKRLMKITEDLRSRKQEMRNTIAKMQAALEASSQRRNNNDMEDLKAELEATRQELREVKERNRELDEECDTCAAYLRERDAQCTRLKEAKAALESKLEELQGKHNLSVSLRKKRQSLHDQLRPNTMELIDASTCTDDIRSYKVERDSTHTEEVQRLKLTIEKLTQQLSLMGAAATQQVYVATGSAIVQNQQITDVMKENQKLKVMNAKLIKICKKRGKSTRSNQQNEDPSE